MHPLPRPADRLKAGQPEPLVVEHHIPKGQLCDLSMPKAAVLLRGKRHIVISGARAAPHNLKHSALDCCCLIHVFLPNKNWGEVSSALLPVSYFLRFLSCRNTKPPKIKTTRTIPMIVFAFITSLLSESSNLRSVRSHNCCKTPKAVCLRCRKTKLHIWRSRK